jgi:hypothetical protein
LLTSTCASSASVASPPSIGRSGAGSCTTAPKLDFGHLTQRSKPCRSMC